MQTALKRLGLVLGVVLLVWLAAPTPVSLAGGGVLVLLGMAVRVWAGGHLSRSTELTTSGPYAYLRDPLYLGRVFLIVGLCAMGSGWDWALLLVGLAVFFGSYMPRKHRKEMARLEAHFGAAYTRYAAQVPSLVPRLTPYPEASRKPWSSKLFWRENREQYLLSAVVLVALLLLLRYRYPC